MNRRDRITQLLLEQLHPLSLYIDDESHTHAGRGRETHFKVLIVSDSFSGQSRVERQRRVSALLQSEFDQGLHALSLRCLTPGEAETQALSGFTSPNCAKTKPQSGPGSF